MKILIVGATDIGTLIAKYLYNEDFDITILDPNMDAIKEITDTYSVAGVVGKHLSLQALEDAGISETDIIIATTNSDSDNLLVCCVSSLLDVQTKIAYLKDKEYLDNKWQTLFRGETIPVNSIISPLRDILKIIKDSIALSYLEISNIISFSDDVPTKVFSIICDSTSEVLNKTVSAISSMLSASHLRCKIIGIERDNKYLIPLPTDTIKIHDKVYVATHFDDIIDVHSLFKKSEGLESKVLDSQSPNIIIAGDNPLIKMFAKELSKIYKKIKIVSNLSTNENYLLSTELSKNTNITILEDDIKNVILSNNSMKNYDDIVILINEEDEKTLINSLVLKEHNIRNIFCFLNSKKYENILIYNHIKHLLIAEYFVMPPVLLNIRRGIISNAYALDGETEIIEFIVTSNSKASGKKISEIEIQRGIIIAGILDKNQDMIILNQDIRLETDYTVIVVFSRRYINEVENIFSYFIEKNI